MYYKILFMTSMVTGTLISISSNSWMGMWIGLEINLLSIIPLMSSTKNMMSSEASMKYFIIQTIMSALLLFSVILMSLDLHFNINFNIYFNILLNTSLLTKMGTAPFHFWFPEVIEGLSWNNSFIIMTWQKIAPMILLMYSNFTIVYLYMSIIMNMMISGIMGINQTSIRKILAYSSINHMGWMISTLTLSESIWFYYFIVYTLITANIIIFLKMFNIFYFKQLIILMNQSFLIKFFFIMNFLSLMGLPPFLGFLPKWLTIQLLIENNFYMISFLMIIMTLLTMYFYLQMTFPNIVIKTNELLYIFLKPFNKSMIMMFNFLALTSLIIVTITFNTL